ncbi:phosphonatase-like hydrolase [Pedobacter sp. GSP4]|uniref:phosphonatase-like hydrolase n=1 Tax=Pedobacter sp. GSP4 TaxID=3453716 RepID=UPI003EE9D076
MSKQKTTMVVFDMAGTTVDENNLVYKTLQNAINEAGYSFSLDDVLAEGAGKEKKQAIASILALENVIDEALENKIYNDFIVSLAEAYAVEEILPQPNAVEVFNALKAENIKVTLDTGYDRTTASQILTKLGWLQGKDFDLLVTASDVSRNRPFPDMIEYAMAFFAINDAKSVVKVGDSAIDIQEGQNAGCGLSIGITTGAHTSQQLSSANPDHIINNLGELMGLIK